MNLSWLDDFLALADSGNFSRAADERHMTQPAFSRRIRALEEWLGAELFDRSSQPAKLTPAGEWFRDAAQDLQARVARVPGEARAVVEVHSTTLRFAATHALSFTFMPGWLRGLESRTTVGPVTLVSDVFARCEAMLLQSQVQFVLSHAHPLSSSELAVAGLSVRACRQRHAHSGVGTRCDGARVSRAGACHGRSPGADAELQRGVRASAASCAKCVVWRSIGGQPTASSRRILHRYCAPWHLTVVAWRGCRKR